MNTISTLIFFRYFNIYPVYTKRLNEKSSVRILRAPHFLCTYRPHTLASVEQCRLVHQSPRFASHDAPESSASSQSASAVVPQLVVWSPYLHSTPLQVPVPVQGTPMHRILGQVLTLNRRVRHYGTFYNSKKYRTVIGREKMVEF